MIVYMALWTKVEIIVTFKHIFRESNKSTDILEEDIDRQVNMHVFRSFFNMTCLLVFAFKFQLYEAIQLGISYPRTCLI